MLPLLYSTDGQLFGGFFGFMKRRARRIFPPYYAALLLFATLIGFAQWRHINSDFTKQMTPVGFITHVFLVHNLSWTTSAQIDPSMWSLATEWQIYIIFALLLIPLNRKIGFGWTLLAAGLVSIIPHLFFPTNLKGDAAFPWFLILFQMGAIGAYWSHTDDERIRKRRLRIPWGSLAAITYATWLLLTYHPVFLPMILQQMMHAVMSSNWSWIIDVICGAATALFLVFIDRSAEKMQSNRSLVSSFRSALVRLLESRPLVVLGSFSYSLYLIHWPILQAYIQVCRMQRLHLSLPAIWLFFPLTGIPLCIALGYLFSLIFEKPFTSAGSRKHKSPVSVAMVRG